VKTRTLMTILIAKIGQPWRPARMLKKRKEQKNKKKVTNSDISRMRSDHPRRSIAPIFGMKGEVADIVIYSKSRSYRFRGFSSTVGLKSRFPYT